MSSKSKAARLYRASTDSMVTIELKTELTHGQWVTLIGTSFKGWDLLEIGDDIDNCDLLGYEASCMFLGPYDVDEDIIDDNGMLKDDPEDEERDGFFQSGDGAK